MAELQKQTENAKCIPFMHRAMRAAGPALSLLRILIHVYVPDKSLCSRQEITAQFQQPRQMVIEADHDI